MADTSKLAAAVAAALEEVRNTRGVQASAVQLINSFADIVKQKIAENDELDQAQIDLATASVEEARIEMVAGRTELGDAIAANGGGSSSSGGGNTPSAGGNPAGGGTGPVNPSA